MDEKIIREIRIDPIVTTKSVLISTARGKRPGQEQHLESRDLREHVDTCPFCPGNEKQTPPAILQVPAAGDWDIRIVENRYPILDDDPLIPELPPPMQQAIAGYGHHEVVIDHPNHGIELHQMDQGHLSLVFKIYRDRMQALYETDPQFKYVLIFKNFGKAAGASIPHSHSQIIAMPIVPHNVHDELQGSLFFYRKTGSCVFCALMDEALSVTTTTYCRNSGKSSRNYETAQYVIDQSSKFVAVKPFASRYEWEVHILPRTHQSNFMETPPGDLEDLGRIIKRTMLRLKAVLGEVQYNFFLHTVPHLKSGSEFKDSYHWHLEICPRTSIPSGFELGSGLFVNTVCPETAARRLRQACDFTSLHLK